MNTCNLCKGLKSLFVKQVGMRPQWFDCPACNTKGAVGNTGPECIAIGQKQAKFCKKIEE